MALRFAAWGLLNLLAAGPGLGLLAAYDATTDGSLALQYPIFNTHSWMTMMGWAVPTIFALVCWLLPMLKDVPTRRQTSAGACLTLLILATFGLAAYLFLAHTGREALFILPVIWVLYLTAAIIYATTVWRITARSLRPTATDVGIQAGAVWLLVVLAIRLVGALGAFATNRHDFLASSDAAVLIAMMFGFIGNTGLALVSAIAPTFLMTAHPRASVLKAFSFYNITVALWCLGAAWVLPFPFSYGRLALTLVGLLLLWAIIRLLMELRLFELFIYHANSRRRRLTRIALSTATLLFAFSGLIVSLIGIWNAATMYYAPQEMITLPMHLFIIGFFANLVIGLFVPLMGARSLAGVKLPLAYGAYLFFLLWLSAKLILAILGIISGEPLWQARYLAGGLAGLAALLLTLWLLAATLFTGSRQTAPPLQPQNPGPPPPLIQ